MCLELINEPLYPADTSDEQVVDYINALADAVRETGCRKPIFYNGWGNRLARCRAHASTGRRLVGTRAVWWRGTRCGATSCRRSTCMAAATSGIRRCDRRTSHTRRRSSTSSTRPTFPAATCIRPWPAAFRAGGAQIATQFQYDPLPLARFNQGWQTHFLNLVCAPQKAVSFVIAAAAFHALPRLAGLRSVSRQLALRSLSRQLRGGPERVGDAAGVLLFEFDPARSPPSPATIERIIGCGSSPLVTYEGTGCVLPRATGARRVAAGTLSGRSLGQRPVRSSTSDARSGADPLARVADETPPGRTWVTRFTCGAVNVGQRTPARRPPVDEFAIRPGVYVLNRPEVATETVAGCALACGCRPDRIRGAARNDHRVDGAA